MRKRTMRAPVSAGDDRGKRLRADFDSNDVNRDGRITLGEFMRFMRNNDVGMTGEECQTAFDEIDTNNDGLIDFGQVLAWWNERPWVSVGQAEED
jgi:Ca2+-binding EF-hand superfamily protein